MDRKIPIDKNILNKFKREVMTEYPVVKLFFLSSNVLCIHKIPNKSESAIKEIGMDNLVKRTATTSNKACDAIRTFKSDSL